MRKMSKDRCDLFVLFAEGDREWVYGYLLDALDAADVSYSYVETSVSGSPSIETIESFILRCNRTLLVISPSYRASALNDFSDLLALTFSVERETYSVIPLILHSTELPPRLAMLASVDATIPSEWDAAITRLCHELHRPPPAILPIPDCPYPGLVPFRSIDAAKFYGRENEVEALIARLEEKLIFVIGPSGSGKSSFIFAGLLPRLERDSQTRWTITAIRPGRTPYSTLQTELQANSEWARDFSRTEKNQKVLLYIDQFDELFTQAETEERSQFIDVLQDFITSETCTIVATLRADFFGDLMNSPLWNEQVLTQFNLAPLRDRSLREAIVRPAEKLRVYLDDALVERLLADTANEPGSLPALQETMRLLWERMTRRLVPHYAYQALGENGKTGLATALALHAEKVFAGLTSPQRVLVRRIFLRLVQFGEGRPDTRRQQSEDKLTATGDDPRVFHETLNYLADQRLLTVTIDEKSLGRRVDISHETLFSGWPILAEWIAQGREAEQTRRRLDAQAVEWERLGRSSGGLLDPIELLEAETWINSANANILGYQNRLLELVNASRKAIANQQKQQRRNRIFVRAATGLVVVLIMFALGIFALGQNQIARERNDAALTSEAFGKEQQRLAAAEAAARGTAVAEQNRAENEVLARSTAQALAEVRRLDAERQRVAAQARELAAQSELIRTQNPNLLPLSLLLAIESVERSPSFGGDQALRKSLGLTLRQVAKKQLPSEFDPTIISLAFSPDNMHFAGGTQSGNIFVWNTVTWNEEWRSMFDRDGTVPAVRHLEFSPDNLLLLAATDDGVSIYDTSTGNHVSHIHPDTQFFYAQFSPDGRSVASASFEKTSIWDARTGNTLLDLGQGYENILFAPNGRLVAATGRDSIDIWDLDLAQKTTSKQIFERNDENDLRAVASVDYSPDGTLIAAGIGDTTGAFTIPRIPQIGRILIWEVVTGVDVATMNHDDAIRTLAFSGDGARLLSSSYDGTTRTWDVKTGQELVRFVHSDTVNEAIWTNSDRAAYSASDDSTARLWDSMSGQELARMVTESKGAVIVVAASPNSALFATGDDKGEIRIWGADERWMPHPYHEGTISSLVYSPDGKYMVTGSWDNTVRISDPATGNEIRRLEQPARVIDAVPSPNSKYIAVSTRRGAKVWDIANGQEVASVLPNQLIGAIAFSPDAKWLAVGSGSPSRDGWFIKIGPPFDIQPEQVTLLSTETWIVSKYFQHDWAISSIAFSPDSRYLISGSDDNTARVWDIPLGTEVARLSHDAHVNIVRFSPDGKRAASVESFYPIFGNPPGKPQVIIWDPLTGKEHWRAVVDEQWISSLVFSPDNKYLAVANSVVETSCESNQTCQNSIVLFNAASGAIEGKMTHENVITTLFFSGDSRFLYSASLDHTFRIWSIPGGSELSRVTSRYQIWTGTLMPDREQLVFAGSTDSENNAFVGFEFLQGSDLIAAACERITRNLTRAEWARFFGNESYRSTCPNLELSE